MGMRVNGSAQMSSTAISDWQQRQQNVKSMMSAIQSGDLSSAQSAYATLQGNQGSADNGPFAAIGQALQSGDISAAQKALTDFQAHRAGGHHHPGHTQTNSVTQTDTTDTGPLADSGTGSNLHYVA
jgi:hypothetical protein